MWPQMDACEDEPRSRSSGQHRLPDPGLDVLDLENVDVAIRFDQIAMLVIGEDRVLLKYHINCLGPGTIAAATEQRIAGNAEAPRAPRPGRFPEQPREE